MPQVLIIYEHKVRELVSCQLLQCELQRRGIRTSIVHHRFYGMWRHKLFSRPRVVVSLCALETEIFPGWSVFNQHADYLRGRADWYLNLQAEQLCREELASYNVIMTPEIAKRMYYICWGPKRREQLLRLGVPEERVPICGPVHLDPLQDPFRQVYQSKEELGAKYGLDASKRWLLFISSFTYASLSPEEKAWVTKVLGRLRGDARSLVDEREHVSINSQTAILEWIDLYLASHDDLFLYRPHPGEKEGAALRALRKKHPHKLFFLREESVQQWILTCDVINTWISSAVVEAYRAHKSFAILQPETMSADLLPPVMDGCETISTYSLFEAAQSEPIPLPIQKERIEEYYRFSGFAYLAICDLVEWMLHQPPPAKERGRASLYLKSRYFWGSIYGSFSAATHIRLGKILPFGRKFFRHVEEQMEEDCVWTKDDRRIKHLFDALVRQVKGES